MIRINQVTQDVEPWLAESWSRSEDGRRYTLKLRPDVVFSDGQAAGIFARGFVVVQITMLVPAFIIAEATLSYVGLGFTDPMATWGTMLHDASNVRVFADFPWLLSPAAAMFLVVLALNLVLERTDMTVRLPSTDKS